MYNNQKNRLLAPSHLIFLISASRRNWRTTYEMDLPWDGVKIVEDDFVILEDCCGIPVHCNSRQALELYNQGLLEFVKGYGDYYSKFIKSLELDNRFLLLSCAVVSCLYCIQTIVLRPLSQ